MANLLDVFDFDPDSHGESRARQLKLAELATRQHGVVTYRQLGEIGFRRGAIEHRLTAGRLHRIPRGVYAVGHRLIPPRGASHRSGAEKPVSCWALSAGPERRSGRPGNRSGAAPLAAAGNAR